MHLQQPARTRIPTQQEFSPRDSSLDGLTAAWWAFPLCKLQRNCQQGWGENYFIARRDGAHTNAKTKQTHQQKGTLIETLSILTQVYRNCGWSFLGDYHTTGGGGRCRRFRKDTWATGCGASTQNEYNGRIPRNSAAYGSCLMCYLWLIACQALQLLAYPVARVGDGRGLDLFAQP